MNTLLGFKFNDWWKLLQENQFAVDPGFRSRAAFISLMSLRNTFYARAEDRLYNDAIAAVQVKEPLFILGHWRSGTTLLHNLLCQDDRFAYPNMFEVTKPHTFLTRENIAMQSLGRVSEKRKMDNVNVTLSSPGEDESALVIGTRRSMMVGWFFPQREVYHDRFITFRDAPAEDLKRWGEFFVWYVKKLTLKYERPLILKSPPHTARISLILKLFPDARFVHIHRNPYVVFRSTQNLYAQAAPDSRLQKRLDESYDDGIIRRYKLIYDAYFAERKLIPPGQLHEIGFEELEGDKVGQIAQLYENLRIPGFRHVEAKLWRYVDSISDYQKNVHHRLPQDIEARINREWEQSFDEWGYARANGAPSQTVSRSAERA